MNQIQLVNQNVSFPTFFLNHIVRGATSFFEQDVSQMAWQIISRSTLELSYACNILNLQNTICTLLPLTRWWFHIIYPAAIAAIDHLLHRNIISTLPVVDTPTPSHIVGTKYFEAATTAASIFHNQFPISQRGFLFFWLTLCNFSIFALKLQRQSSEKVTALFFQSFQKNETLLTEKLLLHQNLQLLSKEKYYSVNPLHVAATLGEKSLSKILPFYLPPYNHKDIKKATPLHYAAAASKVDSLKRLLATSQINLNSRNVFGETALYLAITHECLECIKVLAKEKNLDWKMPRHFSYFLDQESHSPQRLKLVEYLLLHTGMKFKSAEFARAAAWHLTQTIISGSLNLIKTYQKDSRFNFGYICPKTNETFLHIALRFKQPEIAHFLLSIPTIDLTVKNHAGLAAYDLAKNQNLASLAKNIAIGAYLQKLNSTLECLKSSQDCDPLIEQSETEFDKIDQITSISHSKKTTYIDFLTYQEDPHFHNI